MEAGSGDHPAGTQHGDSTHGEGDRASHDQAASSGRPAEGLDPRADHAGVPRATSAIRRPRPGWPSGLHG